MQDEIGKHGKSDLLAIIDSLGGWPLLMGSKFNEEKFVWQNLIGRQTIEIIHTHITHEVEVSFHKNLYDQIDKF